MAWGWAAMTAFSVVYGLISNREQANRNSKMAEWRRAIGRKNAANTYAAAQQYADMTEAMGKYSATLAMMSGIHDANMALTRATYNMQLIDDTAEYNAQLYEEEAKEIWRQLDLDVEWLNQERAKEQADITVSYAHAGVELSSMDTPEQTLMDSKVQQELDIVLLTNAAEEAAGEALDSAAMSRWEGRIAIQQLLQDTATQSMTALVNAQSQATSSVMSSFFDAQMTRVNGANQADALLYEAYYGASSYDANADYYSSFFTNLGTVMQGFTSIAASGAFSSGGAAASTSIFESASPAYTSLVEAYSTGSVFK